MYSKPKYLLALLAMAVLFSACPGPRHTELAVDPMAGVARYDYSGIRIVQQYNDRAYVHLRIYLQDGPALTDPERAGLEALAVAGALGAGAGDMDGATFKARLEALGASVGHFSGESHSVILLSFLAEQTRKTWAVFSKALLEPRFGEAEFAEVRAGMVALWEEKAKKPGLKAEQAAHGAALGLEMVDWESSIEKMASYSAFEARQYFLSELMQKCRMVLLSSGPLGGEELADLLLDNLDLLPSGECVGGAGVPALPVAANLQAYGPEEGAAPMQYVAGVLVREDNNPERTALRHSIAWLLQRRLESRLAESGMDCPANVRVLPHDGFSLGLSISGLRGLTCTEIALSELRHLRTEGLEDAEWMALRREALSLALLRRESAEGALSSLAECLLSDTWESCALEVNLMQKLSTKSMNNLLRKELKGIALAYQGDTSRLDRKVLANF